VVSDRAFTNNDDSPNGLPTTIHPSTPPMTGSLVLFQQEGMKPLARFLLSLPGGVHFRRVGLTMVSKEDLPLATALVVECSRTLKCLYIRHELPGMSILHCVCTNDSILF